MLVMSRKPGGVVEGAIRDADKERNYSIRSEEKGGRRGACRVSDSFATQNISLRNEGLSQIFITFTFELGAIPLQDILDIKKRYACLVS